ncbi:MAG: GHKL domain-containing protein [Deltaproteobacteria bacterium]|nr:MAG: GHKL domain-containing protein [Deltaproteobacteria bacterium]
MPFFNRNHQKKFEEIEKNLQQKISELSEEKNQLQLILDSMVEGVLVTNAQGQILLYNPSLSDIFSIQTPCQGKRVLECIRHKGLDEMIEKVLREKTTEELEMVLHTLDDEKHIMVRSSPYQMGTGALGSVSVFNDVTRIRQLERTRRDFVANVSHELKTPLTNIRGYAETLNSGALEDKDAAKRFLEKIERNAIHLQELVEDILSISEIESGRFELHIKEFNLVNVLEDLIEQHQLQISEKKLTLDSQLSQAGTIRADEKAMKQIFNNLLENAIKYTPEQGKITVRAFQEKSKIRIEIEDTGIGIPEADQPFVFERFYRVDKARSRPTGGTGLGLSIVKHLVQAHGGEVGMKSDVGKGSLFWFTISLS